MMKRLLLILCVFGFAGQSWGQINCQETPMWCWTACVQSALGQAGVHQTQSQIASRLTGTPVTRPATIDEVIGLLRSYNFRAWSVDYPATPQQLYNTLREGWKLIAFVNPSRNPAIGHFIMLQGISPYTGNIIVSDPATCLTYEQNIQQLYYAWNWNRSIVVGTPQS